MNENLTIAEFQDWISSPIGCKVRNYLVQQYNEYTNLDETLAEQVANLGDMESLEKLGLDSAIRMATARGIGLFTDTNALSSELFPEAAQKAEKEGKDV